MVTFANTERKGETLELKAGEREAHVLGPGLVLSDCTVACDVKERGLVVAGLIMRGGAWRQSVSLNGYTFEYARFENVAFSGDFEGVVFGDLRDEGKGHALACDFSAATMDGTRFAYQAEAITLPGWPHFAIEAPAQVAEAVAAAGLPEDLAEELEIFTDQPESCALIVADGAVMAKRAGLSLEALKGHLAALPGVRITG